MSHLTLRDFATFAALVLSLGAFLRSRHLDKRDLFLKMHENLLDPLPMRGRRLLYTIKDPSAAAAVAGNDDDQTAVYRALAGFDVLGLYVEHGWVDERTVLEEWANSLSETAAPKALFVAARYPGKTFHSWPHYDALSALARQYRSGTYRPTRLSALRRRARALVRRPSPPSGRG